MNNFHHSRDLPEGSRAPRRRFRLPSAPVATGLLATGLSVTVLFSGCGGGGGGGKDKKATPTPTTGPTLIPTVSGTVTATPLTTPFPTGQPTSTPLRTATPRPGSTATPVATATPNASTLVGLATIYLNTLTTTQRSATLVTSSATNAAKWSNLAAVPANNGTNNLRNGVAYSSLSSTSKTAWTNLVAAALGSTPNSQFSQIRTSDDYLNGFSSSYSGDFEYIGFVGTPSASGSWMLQVGGHNIAHNYYYSGNNLQSTTPYSLGVEPPNFFFSGSSFSPLSNQRNGMLNLINSLSLTQLNSAQLSGNFSDVFLGPGRNSRSLFPTGTTGRGILASSLNSTQRNLMLTAISAWTNNSRLSSTYQSLYSSELNSTYLAYSGTTALNNQGDYVRIDGPHVWIEFVCLNGVVITNQVQYHTIWRDRVTDYNAAFGF